MLKKYKNIILLISLIFLLTACQSGLSKDIQSDNKQSEPQSDSQVKYKTKEVVDKKTIRDKKQDFEVTLDYVYDDYGRLIKVRSIYEGDSAVVERYKYNDQGQKIYSYDSSNEDGLEEEINYEYNDAGQLIKKVTTREDGFVRTQQFEYNQAGKEIKEIDKRKQDGEEIAKFIKKKKYNDNNKLVELKLVRNGELIRTEEYAYDEKGNKTLSKKLGTDPLTGEEYCKWYEWEYDKEGKVLKKVKKNRKGMIIEGEKNTYDKEGNKVKVVYLKKEGKIDRTTTNIYNSQGNLKKSLTKKPSGEVLFESMIYYDERGNRKKFIMKEKGEVTDINKYEYDKEGNVIKSIWTNVKNGEKKIDQIRTYKYDKYGNKILEIHKNNQGVVLERTEKTFFGKDKLKRKKTVTRWDDGLLEGKYKKRYNKRGDLIKKVEIGGDVNGVETLINKEYEYKYKKIKFKRKGE